MSGHSMARRPRLVLALISAALAVLPRASGYRYYTGVFPNGDRVACPPEATW